MRLLVVSILLSIMGCVAAPKAASSPLAAAQPPCPSIFRPEMREAMLVNLLEFYQQHEGRPYLMEIAKEWLTVHPVGYCEAAWEHGDLNSDGRIDMEDFAIYAGSQ